MRLILLSSFNLSFSLSERRKVASRLVESGTLCHPDRHLFFKLKTYNYLQGYYLSPKCRQISMLHQQIAFNFVQQTKINFPSTIFINQLLRTYMEAPSKSTIKPTTYLLLYCFIFFNFGLLSGSYGPIIPYLSKQTHVPETSYSFLFVGRSLGSIIGFLLFKYLQKHYPPNLEHKIIVFYVIADITFLNVFAQVRSTLWEFLSLLCFGGSRYVVLTATNICLIAISGKHTSSWLILVNALYGVGALLSPQMVRIFETDLYNLTSLLYLSFALLCLYFPTPEKHSEQSKDPKQQDKTRQTSNSMVAMLSIALFLTSGIESTVSGWFPSYTVQAVGTTKSEATIYVTIFWGLNTLFRFVNASLPSIKGSFKLNTLVPCIFMVSLACVALNHFQAHALAVQIGSVCFGISCSAVYPLLIGIFKEFNIKLRPEQTANMMFVPILSNMCLTGTTGAIMKYDLDYLFYSLTLMAILLLIDWTWLNRLMSQPEQNPKNEKAVKID